jgi:hypothetical protein
VFVSFQDDRSAEVSGFRITVSFPAGAGRCVSMMRCDVCRTTPPCLQREIEGKEFDVCERCGRCSRRNCAARVEFFEIE